MVNNETFVDMLNALLPAFDETQEITSRQIRQTSPKIQIEPYPRNVRCYTAEIGLRLWEQGKIFGLIIDSALVNDNPYSNQIFRGTNELNEPLSNYRIYSSLSQEDGSAVLLFDDLIHDTEYTVFLTIGNNLPYEPLMLYEDIDVRILTLKTPLNINLNYNVDNIE